MNAQSAEVLVKKKSSCASKLPLLRPPRARGTKEVGVIFTHFPD
jgi:hypothetical protein